MANGETNSPNTPKKTVPDTPKTPKSAKKGAPETPTPSGRKRKAPVNSEDESVKQEEEKKVKLEPFADIEEEYV